MSSEYYLFLPACKQLDAIADNGEVSWVSYDQQQNPVFARGSLEHAAEQAKGKKVTVVINGRDVLFLQADVPGKNLRVVQQAVPYLLEEQLVDDVENLHFAIRHHADSAVANRYDVLVINQSCLMAIIQLLEEKQIHADIITADYLLLPHESLLLTGSRVLFSSSPSSFATEADSAVLAEPLDIEENQSIKVIACDNADRDIALDSLLQGKPFNIEQCHTSWQQALVAEAGKQEPFNLLQGRFKKKKNWSAQGRAWLPAASVFLLWLLLQGGLFITDYIILQKQASALDKKINALYRQTFPQAKRIVNARVQMQQQLDALRKKKGQGGNRFSTMLLASAEVLSRIPGLEIRTLRYYDGRLNLELKLADLQQLEKLKQEIDTEKGYQVDVQGASSEKDHVIARIQISGGAV